MKRRDENIDDLLEEIKKHMISGDKVDVLMAYLSEESRTKINIELKMGQCHPNGRRYTNEIKAFAVILDYYSPTAYEFLHSHLVLPDASIIRRCASSINCEPGFSQDALDHLK